MTGTAYGDRPQPERASKGNESEGQCGVVLRAAAAYLRDNHGLLVSFAPQVMDELTSRADDFDQLQAIVSTEITKKLCALVAEGRLDSGDAIAVGVREDGHLSCIKER